MTHCITKSVWKYILEKNSLYFFSILPPWSLWHKTEFNMHQYTLMGETFLWVKFIPFLLKRFPIGLFIILFAEDYLFLIIRLPPELLPVLGPLKRWRDALHLTWPCFVALGRVLIWVVSPFGLRSFVNWVFSFQSRAQCFSEGEIMQHSSTLGLPYSVYAWFQYCKRHMSPGALLFE